MTTTRTARKAVAALLSAALIGTSMGPGAASALAEQVRAAPVQGNTQPVPTVVALGNGFAPAGSALTAPGYLAPLQGALPGLTSPIPRLGQTLGTAEAPTTLPALQPTRAAPLTAVAPAGTPAAAPTASPADLDDSQGGLPALIRAAVASPDRSAAPDIPQEALAPPSGVRESAGASKEWSERSFLYLKGENTRASASQDAPAGPVDATLAAAGPGAKSAKGSRLGKWLPRIIATGLGFSLLNCTTPSDAIHAAPVAAQPPQLHSALWDGVGQAGYAIGNTLGFLFPIPQVYKTFKDGNAKAAPLGRIAILVAASLALGLVNATIAGKWFWGVQNIFGAVISLSIIPIARWLGGKAPKASSPDAPGDPSRPSDAAPGTAGRGWSPAALLRDKALLGTLAVTAAALALSAGIYFAAAAVVPGLLTHLLTAAGISKLALAIQAVTGGLYFLLFVPDIVSLLRGTPPKGFTPGFSMSFFIASLGFVLWTGQMAHSFPGGSPERQQFLIYLALNAAYAVLSFVSWVVAIRHRAGKTTGGPGRQAAAATAEEASISESLAAVRELQGRGDDQAALAILEDHFAGQSARGWFKSNRDYLRFWDEAMALYRGLESKLLALHRSARERGASAALIEEAGTAARQGTLKGGAWRPTPRQPKDSSLCAQHALYNAISAAAGFAAPVSASEFARQAALRLNGKTVDAQDTQALRRLGIKVAVDVDRGMSSGDIGRLAKALGMGFSSRPAPRDAGEMLALLRPGQAVVLSLRLFHASGRHPEEDAAFFGHEYRPLRHAVHLLGAFPSESAGGWVFMVQDSGSGSTDFYRWDELAPLIESVELLETSGPVRL